MPEFSLPSHPLKIISWNSNSIKNKIEFKQFLTNQEFDIVALQETSLSDKQTYKVNGYNSVYHYPDPIKHHRGLITLIRRSLCYTINQNSDNLEYQSITIKLKNQDFHFFNVYASPSVELYIQDFKPLFNNRHSIIVGDFNAKSQTWYCEQQNARGQILDDLLLDLDFVILNNKIPTHLHHNGTTNVLDLAISTSDLSGRCQFSVVNNSFASDHNPIVISINSLNPPLLNFEPKWQLKRADWDLFKLQIQQNTHKNPPFNPDPDIYYNNLLNIITTSADVSIPKSKIYHGKQKRIHKNVPYWSVNIQTAIYSRNKARNKFLRNKTIENGINYRKLKASAQKLLKQERKAYWHNYCSTLNQFSDVKKVWSTIKSINGVHSDNFILCNSLKSKDQIFTENKDKANLIAEFFSEVSSDKNLDPRFLQSLNSNSSSTHQVNSIPELKELNSPFTSYEIHRAITNLPDKTAPGVDKIHYSIIKHLPTDFINVLLEFFNFLWSSGSFPNLWRHSIIVPIPKPDKDHSLPNSYRPISLTATLCKLMERLVTDRLVWILEKNDILNNNQFGFRKNRSTLDSVLKLQDYIHKALHVGKLVLAVFIDLEKAYDIVYHKILITKFRELGFTGNILTFITNFLSNRTFQVKIGNEFSDIFFLKNGTPQGSVISPILFLVIINDSLQKILHMEKSLFADDCTIYKSGPNIDYLVKQTQASLNEFQSWCITSGFKISALKTTIVLFTNSHSSNFPEINIKLDNVRIPTSDHVKYLGVVFDSKLNWSKHVNYIINKLSRRVNILKAISSNSWGANKKTLSIVYKALFRSVMDYGSTAYFTASASQLQKIDRLKNICLRIINHSSKNSPIDALEVDCGEVPLDLRRKELIYKQAIKIFSTPKHPNSEIIQDSWENHYGHYSTTNSTFYSQTIDFLNTIKLIPINPLLSYSKIPPWARTEIQIDLSLTLYESKKQNPNCLKTAALNLIEHHKNSIQVYTDSSKHLDGKMGIGIYFTNFDLKISHRLTNNLSIYTGELTAICTCLKNILNFESNTIFNFNFVIFTDSLSALKSLSSQKSNSNQTLLDEILYYISLIKSVLQFVWIPSHLGIPGNEVADLLANSATTHSHIDIKVKLELQDLHSLVTSNINSKWQEKWSKSTSLYYQINPKVDRKPQMSVSNRKMENFFTKIRFNQINTNSYLHYVGRHSTGFCDHCAVPETLQHYVIDCPFGTVSKFVKSACKCCNIENNLPEVLSSQLLLTKLYNFISAA